jgi:hypothetical protein
MRWQCNAAASTPRSGTSAVSTSRRSRCTLARTAPGRKKDDKYLLIACTRLYTHFLLGDRDLDTFKASVLADVAAGTVVVHDRYTLYDNKARSPASSTSFASSTSCVTWPVRVRPTPTRCGPPRSPTPCAH